MADTLDNCTLATCPASASRTGYIPSLGGNAFFIAWFALLLLAQSVLGFRYKTYSYLFGQACGLILEIIGYASRVLLHHNPFAEGPFLSYLVTITIAPAFFCFTIYLCFGRVVLVYGNDISRISYRAYTVTFVTLDIICLVLQASGASRTQHATTANETAQALRVLKAGLGLQVASLAFFLLLALEFSIRAMRHKEKWSEKHQAIRSAPSFHLFLLAYFSAAVLILVRSAYRVAELQNGPSSKSASNQALFMVFEGGVVGLAILLMTIFHPGFTFGAEWKSLSFSAKKRRQAPQSAVEMRDIDNDPHVHR